jgi:hypothetical protein
MEGGNHAGFGHYHESHSSFLFCSSTIIPSSSWSYNDFPHQDIDRQQPYPGTISKKSNIRIIIICNGSLRLRFGCWDVPFTSNEELCQQQNGQSTQRNPRYGRTWRRPATPWVPTNRTNDDYPVVIIFDTHDDGDDEDDSDKENTGSCRLEKQRKERVRG